MRVLIAGGKLQGVEATYLAKQAGWSASLIDRKPFVPARGICDEFYQLDILLEPDRLRDIIKGTDFVIPAIEDEAVLVILEDAGRRAGVPVACDLSSYTITSSKKRSDRLFAETGIPAPRYWPKCEFPVIAKPSEMSGSKGVKKFYCEPELTAFFEQSGSGRNNYLVQEYLDGDSYSLEVVGFPGHYVPLQVTDLHFDSEYDCKRVSAPTRLIPKQQKQFRDLGVRIAKLLQLKGIMDVEVIDDHGTLKVLEIDARLPSQTPTVVYLSTGINILVLLYELYTKGKTESRSDLTKPGGVVYEHVKVTPGSVEVWGEHIISQAGCLNYRQDFFGADQALTDYIPGSASWVATLIITGSDLCRAWEKRCWVLDNIQSGCGLSVSC